MPRNKNITNRDGLTPEGKKLATTIGQNIRIARKLKGLSQAQLASLCGFEQAAISMLEKGKRGMSTNTIAKLSKALNIPPDRLLKPIKI